VETVARVLDEADEWSAEPATVDDVLAADGWARQRARELVEEASS
jgi:1-deoxy-D-xylulose-5-phosphate reductoisomerase